MHVPHSVSSLNVCARQPAVQRREEESQVGRHSIDRSPCDLTGATGDDIALCAPVQAIHLFTHPFLQAEPPIRRRSDTLAVSARSSDINRALVIERADGQDGNHDNKPQRPGATSSHRRRGTLFILDTNGWAVRSRPLSYEQHVVMARDRAIISSGVARAWQANGLVRASKQALTCRTRSLGSCWQVSAMWTRSKRRTFLLSMVVSQPVPSS